MALIRFGNGVADIRGSINGTTFSRVRGGAIARNRTVPINPNTPAQIAARLSFQIIVNMWTSLTAAGRAQWNEYAATLLFINRLGETFVPTGRMVFMRFNGRLGYHTGSPLTLPPVASDPPLVPNITSLEFDVTDGEWAALDLNLTDPGADFTLQLESTHPLNGNTKIPANRWRNLKAGTITTGVMALVSEWTSVFGSATITKDFFMGLRARKIDNFTGQVSPWVTFEFPTNGAVTDGLLTAVGSADPIGS
jgi:hypothetical protein